MGAAGETSAKAHIHEAWSDTSWIVELEATRLFLTSRLTNPDALM